VLGQGQEFHRMCREDPVRFGQPRQSSNFGVAVLLLTLLASLAAPLRMNAAQPDQNPAKNLTLEQLGNVEITTATKEPEQVWNTSAAIFVITREDIKRSGATSVPEALRLAPGVEVARIDSSRWSIGIRGFGSRLNRSVLVLIDGRSVYTTLLAGTYWEVQNLMLEDVDRIEVIRGPGGTIWGPNAVNGVINIITRSSKDTHGALLSVGGGNEEQGFFRARYGGGNGHGLNYRFYALGFNRSPEFHSDGNNFDRWQTIQGGFRMDWTRDPGDTITVQGDLYDEGTGESVTLSTYNPPANTLANGNAPLSGGNILARWRRVFDKDKDFQIQISYDRNNRHELNFVDLRDTFDLDFLDRFPLAGHQEISWGGSVRISNGSNPVVISGLFFSPKNRTDQLFSGFLQDDIDLVPNRLSMTVGSKILHTNFTGVEWQPSIRLLWRPTETQSVWAAFTHALRTPSGAERNFYLSSFLGTDPTTGLPFFARFNANPDFTSEQLNGYELGYRRLFGHELYVDVAGFYNHYADLFSEDITGSIFVETDPAPTHLLLPARFGNGLLGNTAGLEIAPVWMPSSRWDIRGSYSFLNMELRKASNSLDIGTAPTVEGSSPSHQFMIQPGMNPIKPIRIDLTFRYVSALPKQNIPSYATADARLGWNVSDHVELSVVGRNLFQHYHYEFPGDPGPLVGIKRSVYGQLTLRR
jgi:iron complex outermembrane recepter protein